MSRIVGRAGLPISEPMTCGLGGGIGFLYAVFEYAAVPHPLLTIVTQHHPAPWLETAAQHRGLTTVSVTSSPVVAAITKLGKAVDGGRPAWVVVGRGHLPWHSDGRPEETADPYPVLVTAHEGSEFILEDDGPIRRIGATDLGVAWAAHRKGRLAVTTVDSSSGTVDLAAAARLAVRTTHAHLTGPVIGNSFDANFGLSGIERLLVDLRDTKTKKGWLRRFGSPACCACWWVPGAGRWRTRLRSGPTGSRSASRSGMGRPGRLVRPTARSSMRSQPSGSTWARPRSWRERADGVGRRSPTRPLRGLRKGARLIRLRRSRS